MDWLPTSLPQEKAQREMTKLKAESADRAGKRMLASLLSLASCFSEGLQLGFFLIATSHLCHVQSYLYEAGRAAAPPGHVLLEMRDKEQNMVFCSNVVVE